MGSTRQKKLAGNNQEVYQNVRKNKKKRKASLASVTEEPPNEPITRLKKKSKKVSAKDSVDQELEVPDTKGQKKKSSKVKDRQILNNEVSEQKPRTKKVDTKNSDDTDKEPNDEKKSIDELLVTKSKKRKSTIAELDKDETAIQAEPLQPKKKKVKTEEESAPIQNGSIHFVTEPITDVQVNNKLMSASSDEMDSVLTDQNYQMDTVKKDKNEIPWPTEDLVELINKMEICIPEGDHLSFRSRLGKFDWNLLLFKNYSVEECQSMWTHLEKKVRGYRLLAEVLEDARKIAITPRKIPTPKAPPTSYTLFCRKKKRKIAGENPEMQPSELTKYMTQLYKNLPPQKKSKYERLAQKYKEEFEKNLEQFYEHCQGDIPDNIKQRILKLDKAPKKPEGPFKLYYLSQAKSEEQDLDVETDKEFKESCKENWKNMSDKKKLVWITAAEEQYKVYEAKMNEYISSHPDYVPQKSTKNFLSREIVLLKDRIAGKPKKPPNSVYSLYTSIHLISENIKHLTSKEKFLYVSNEWKNLSEEERNHYKDLLTQATEEYKRDFNAYLESLPEDKRQEELANQTKKKNKNEEKVNQEKGKKKIKEESVNHNNNNMKKRKKKNNLLTKEEKGQKRDEILNNSIGNHTSEREINKFDGRPQFQRPFDLFVLSEQQNLDGPLDKQAFRSTCRDKWTELPDEDKIMYIREAEEQYKKYEAFIKENPKYATKKVQKSVLTKDEKQIKERVSGRPKTPAKGVYQYFIGKNLNSEEIRRLPHKERITHISASWRELSNEEKAKYKDKWLNTVKEYEKRFQEYLQTLPEDQREEELKMTLSHSRKKTKTPGTTSKKSTKKKSKKLAKEVILREPEQPPISIYAYFAQTHTGDIPAATAWKSLSAAEKKCYQDKLDENKRKYIKDFEVFLRSLSKEQLEEFSKQRMKTESNAKSPTSQAEEEDSDDEEDDEEEENASEDDEESN